MFAAYAPRLVYGSLRLACRSVSSPPAAGIRNFAWLL